MAQDVRETGSTHSVSTVSDVHEQVRRNERTNRLASLFPSSIFALHDAYKRKRELSVVRFDIVIELSTR